MSYLEELLPEFRNGAKIRCNYWDEENYIQLKEDGYIYDDKDDRIEVSTLTLFGKSWEFYKEPEPDLDYIINNKCLCWFWDDDTEEPNFADRLLAVVENESGIKYLTKGKVSFAYCRPVRKDEVTFYEERKDE